MENEADVDQRVLHYELDLPNMRIHDLLSADDDIFHENFSHIFA